MAARTPRWGLRILVIGVVLVGCAAAAEYALRLVETNTIASHVRTVLKLEANHEVRVDLTGSALLAAVQGKVGAVSVAVDKVPLVDGISGDLSGAASSLPFAVTRGEMTDAHVTVSIAADQLPQIAALATNGTVDNATVTDGELQLTHTVSVLGMNLPLSVRVGLGVQNGDIQVTPGAVSAGTWQLTAEQIRAATGSLLDGMLSEHAVCIADRLPKGVVLRDIELRESGGVQATADLSPTLLSDPAEQSYGTCGSDSSVS